MIAIAPISPAATPRLLRELGLPFGAGVTLQSVEPGSARSGPDLWLRLMADGETFRFAAVARSRGVPRVVEEGLREARRRASEAGALPLLIVPYLSERALDRLLEDGVSGLDLCGNGLIVIPGRLLLRRDGRPNRYPESRPARFAYRGATSLVPRVFLRRREYGSVGQIREEVERAGGSVAPSTVSKALARMVEDLLIERSRGRIALMRADELLDRLAESFEAPPPRQVSEVKLALPLESWFAAGAGAESRPRLVLSGAASQDRYAGGLRADVPVLYTDDLDALLERVGSAVEAGSRYPDAKLIETGDPGAFFDTRRDEAGVVYASPVQTYLELASTGDKRDRDMAQQVRALALRASAGGESDS